MMKSLFSQEGRSRVARMMASEPLLAFDFDGTLAPIVPVPDLARVPTAVAHRLEQLAARHPVAVITGRAVADVRPRLTFEPWRIVGSHGAESSSSEQSEQAVIALNAARRHLATHHAELELQGIALEDKGASLALHYRLSADRDAALHYIGRLLSDLPAGLAVFGGKLVANIVPEWANDKAAALSQLVEERARPYAIFIGDDVNDECVFARRNPDWLTIRVGHDYPNSQADFVVDSTNTLPLVLDLLQAMKSM
jgi:trehalose 6-phosphate phosphatase